MKLNYQETVSYLFNRLPMYQRVGGVAIKKTLENSLALDEALGHPHNQYHTIHVAGTNGKGSSSHMLAAMLQAHGLKTGLYTSPHLKNFTERIRVDGKEIPQDSVIAFVEKIKPDIEKLSPSFFEITVAMALDYFARCQVDVAIIEVGLGGRLDSTNIIQPKACLITNIGYDHMDMLGDTLPEIAAEKAGIIKENIPVTISQKQAEVAAIFTNKAKTNNAPLTFAETVFQVKEKANGLKAIYRNEALWLGSLTLELLGSHQVKNLVGALHCCETFTQETGIAFEPEKARLGLSQITKFTGLKGRWQQLSKKPLSFCDVGHNEDGMKSVKQQLAKYHYQHLHIVFGIVEEKSPQKLLAQLPQDATYYFCKPNMPRGLDASKLKMEALQLGRNGLIFDSVQQAIDAAYQNATNDDLIFIGGSNFVVAEIRNL